jgi:proton-coupled amino acid transporter
MHFSYSHISFLVGWTPLTVLVALTTENLDRLMSLVGALTCTFVCLIFPPILDIITFCHKPLGWFRLAKNVFIILMALVVFATGTLAAVMAFKNYFKEDSLYGSRVTR